MLAQEAWSSSTDAYGSRLMASKVPGAVTGTDATNGRSHEGIRSGRRPGPLSRARDARAGARPYRIDTTETRGFMRMATTGSTDAGSELVKRRVAIAPAPHAAGARGPRQGGSRRGPRGSHGEWSPRPPRRPIELLEQQATSRVPELVPIRYGRMMVSPFTFYRGAAYVMAADLAATPRSG